MPEKPDDASVSTEISTLECEIEELTGLMRARRDEAKTLLMTEDPAQGIFHHDRIFTVRQDVLRLETEIMIRRNKINRLRLGEAGPGLFA